MKHSLQLLLNSLQNRIELAKTVVAITIISDSDEMCHNVSSNVTLSSDI